MSRGGITVEEVIGIAEQLAHQGEIPTIEKIRFRLGRGSNSTIAKHLNQWKIGRLKTTDQDAGLVYSAPDPVNQAVAKVWQQLQEENQTKLAELEAATAEKIQLAEDGKDKALKENQRLEKDNHDLRTLLKETRERNEVLEKETIVLKQQLAAAEVKGDSLEKAHYEFKAFAERVGSSLEEKYQQTVSQSVQQLADCKAQQKQEVTQLKDIAENQRHQFIVEIDHLKTAQQKLQGQLAEKEKSLLELAQRWSFVSTQLRQQQEQGALLETTLDQQVKALTTLDEKIGQTSQNVSAIVGESVEKSIHELWLRLSSLLQSKTAAPTGAKKS